MKLLLDFLPLILFFVVFKGAEGHADAAAVFATEHFGFLVQGGVVGAQEAPVLLATLVVMVATLAQAAVLKLRGQKIDLMLWISLVLVVTLGAATVWFHNETFIKWKPTGLYWSVALALWMSQVLFGKNLVRGLLGKQMELPEAIWLRLNRIWVLFFAALGVLNLYVAYNFSTSAWANFKVFGVTGLMFAFMLAQGLYASKYLPPEQDSKP
ncbi:MAG: septation protein A [Rubrivivax sp.]|nr:MAG: septation protein A [Rubrivivax sp.]